MKKLSAWVSSTHMVFLVLFRGLISHLGSTHDLLLFQGWPFIPTWYYGLESKFYLSLPIWIADSSQNQEHVSNFGLNLEPTPPLVPAVKKSIKKIHCMTLKKSLKTSLQPRYSRHAHPCEAVAIFHHGLVPVCIFTQVF